MSPTAHTRHPTERTREVPPLSTRTPLHTDRIVPSPFFPPGGERFRLAPVQSGMSSLPRGNYLVDNASISGILERSLIFEKRIKVPERVLDRDAFDNLLKQYQTQKFNLPETKIYRPNQSFLGRSIETSRRSSKNRNYSRVDSFYQELCFERACFISR